MRQLTVALTFVLAIIFSTPALACSSVGRINYRAPFLNNNSVFLGRITEKTPTYVVFKVLSTRGKYAIGEHVRVPIHIPSECDSQPDYDLDDIWLHDGKQDSLSIAYPYPNNYAEDNGQNIEKLIESVLTMLEHQNIPPHKTILELPLFEYGQYTLNTSCSTDDLHSKLESIYSLNISPINASWQDRHLVKINIQSCENVAPCRLREWVMPRNDHQLIITPIGQTACKIVLAQSAQGVTVKENDHEACFKILNCQITTGLDTPDYLQKQP